MWHRVDMVLTDVSEERIASIFRVEGKIIRKSARDASVRDVKGRLSRTLRVRTYNFPFYPKDGGDTFLRNVG
jgi:hypothetical protein